MKKKQLLKQIIRDFHLSENFDVKPRNIQPPIDTKKIITLIGVRRCGKTSIFYHMINQLIEKIEKTKILFLNFEDERFELNSDELDLILQAYMELYPSYKLSECYFFFDEIQNIPNWEKFIRRMYDTISKNIFITGSNSKLLSSEIATSLRGRTLNFEIFPLSFKEYLSFKDIEVDFYSSKSLAFIKNAQESFLKNGSFPEILFLEEIYANKTLQEYFNVLLYKDLAERYNITNTVALKFFLKRIISSSTKQISINKIFNELKSSGIKIGKNTLYEFLEYVQNIYLALTLQKYDNSLINKELGEKKIYSIDIGLNNATEFRFSDDIGKSLENAVFLELKRKEFDIYYYRTSKSECDFLVFDKNTISDVIQVTFDMSDENTKSKEIKGLIEACKNFDLKSGTIITFDSEDELIENGIKIKIIPFYKWSII
ncbi:ATP-binding protein [Arcobacter defluvii]|uniref:ATP-binding protein (AAA domain) n=1 Tax=Arcobacter defluvii TaxID=873191 RepID=A0AAE7BHP5_9BACT|nr:ATP-binding protein [Arcobacter defluvii]QKF78783.1 ATP-binding protein (AAA domain) [Arcobacter defluvii]RXI33908.1 ATPase [Arcobacter defluvii]